MSGWWLVSLLAGAVAAAVAHAGAGILRREAARSQAARQTLTALEVTSTGPPPPDGPARRAEPVGGWPFTVPRDR